MINLSKISRRNRITPISRRYNLSQMISESYKTLYECEVDSPLYKIVECHINDIKSNPDEIEKLSENLSVLKSLATLGAEAKIRESDIPDEEEEELDEDDGEATVASEESDALLEDDGEATVSSEEDDALLEDDGEATVASEESDALLEDDGEATVASEEDDALLEDEYEEESPEITPEELQELKKHLKEIRRQRRMKLESENAGTYGEDENCPAGTKCREEEPLHEDEEEEEVEECKESCGWGSEKKSMTSALKKFRESSKKKAFFRSFTKIKSLLGEERELTLSESIFLYKASNSAMTHLAVELEHNPEFIYTFRECTSRLSKDNESLLKCIHAQKSPSKSLVESYRTFSNILLESDEIEDELMEDDEEILAPQEEEVAGTPEDILPENEDSSSEEEILGSESEPELEESEDEIPSEEAPLAEPELEESEDEELEVPAEETEPELDEDDSEITDEEAEELKKRLSEIRKSRKKR